MCQRTCNRSWVEQVEKLGIRREDLHRCENCLPRAYVHAWALRTLIQIEDQSLETLTVFGEANG